MRICLFLMMPCLLLSGLAMAAPAISVDGTHLKVSSDGQSLMTYHYAGVPFKAYAETLTTPGGIQVLRDAPHDHLHHHALMYAIGIDGVSYWAETEKDGSQRHQRFVTMGVEEKDGFTWAGFTEELAWTPPDSEAPVAMETRVVGIMEAPEVAARLLTWSTRLQLVKDARSVLLTGSHYYGLGMRFIESMDNGGNFIYASGKAGDIVRGDERNTPADWCAYQAMADGKPVTVAMFSAPKNPRHPTVWFTMGDASEAFAYLSATLNLYKDELKFKKRSPLTMTYGVAVMDGHTAKEDIDALYTWWKKHAPGALE